MKKEMIINVLQPEECRIAIVEDGVLEELYVERTSHESYVGNIYKGRIVNIEPSIQAAFVDFGVGRNGFLHVSDVEPTYYRHLMDSGRRESSGRRGDRGGRSGRPRSRQEARPDPFPPEEPLVGESFAEDLPTEAKTPSDVEGGVTAPEPPLPEESAFPADEESSTTKDLESHSFSFSGEDAEEGPEPAPDSEQDEPSAPDDRPRYMDSAERHTEEDASSPGPDDTSADDADIFFPRPSSPETSVEGEVPPPSEPEASPTEVGQPEESMPALPTTETAELHEEPAESDWAREEIRADDFGAETEDYAPR